MKKCLDFAKTEGYVSQKNRGKYEKTHNLTTVTVTKSSGAELEIPNEVATPLIPASL